MLRFAWGSAFVLLVSCGGEATPDLGPPPDVGPPVDRGPIDLGTDDRGPVDQGPPPTLTLTAIAIDGTAFTDFAFVPGTGDELLVTEHGGSLSHYRLDGDAATLLGSIPVPDNLQMNDCGVHTVVFDPGWATNRFVFVGHCGPSFETRVTRLTWDGATYGDDVADTAAIIVDIAEPRSPFGWNHSIGSLRFDDDGMLLVPVGDKAVPPNGRDLFTPISAILRVEPSREAGVGGYAVPDDNPFVGTAGAAPEIFVTGARYPWRMARGATGRLWFGDVGEGRAEEVNLVPEAGGADFGWDACEGPCPEPTDGLSDPLTSWGRANDHPYVLDDPDTELTFRRSVWVGDGRAPGQPDVYGGRLDDEIFFGDVCTGWVRGATANEAGDALAEDRFVFHLPYVVRWTFGPDGHAYALTFGSCDSAGQFEPPSLSRVDLQ